MNKVFQILPVCLLLSGCGLQFTYNQLDWLGLWYVNGYVSLDSQQKAEFRQRWDAQLDWHRKTQLSGYVQLLKELKLMANSGLKKSDLLYLSDQVEQFYRSSMQHLAPDLTYFASQANEQQAQELLLSLQEENHKWEKKYLAPKVSKRDKRRITDTTDSIEYWTGPLNAQQLGRIKEWNRQLTPIAKEMLEQRERWHSKLADYFSGNMAAGFQGAASNPNQALASLISDPQQLWSKQYQAKIEHNKEVTYVLLLDLFSHLSEQQFAHLNKKLDQTIADLLELSTAGNTLLVKNSPLNEGLSLGR